MRWVRRRTKPLPDSLYRVNLVGLAFQSNTNPAQRSAASRVANNLEYPLASTVSLNFISYILPIRLEAFESISTTVA
jgi:hypothetical protein